MCKIWKILAYLRAPGFAGGGEAFRVSRTERFHMCIIITESEIDLQLVLGRNS